jgi:16S rRNA (cytosine967-C5)-methyltransferase
MFVNLMQRDDCQETYVTYLLDMMNGAFHPDRMAATIQSIADTIYPALEMYLDCSPYVADNFDMAAFERRYGRIITYAQQRADIMYRHINDVYGLGSLYTLKVDVPDGAGVQVNTLKITTDALVEKLASEDVVALPHSWMPDCLVLSNTGDLEHLNAFKEGLFYVQDAASKLAVQCAQIPEGENVRVLDCCAAPGGKSFAAAIAMGGKGKLRSADIHRHKTTLIQHGADRLGLTNILVREQDATQNHRTWFQKMDVVICDVPCSGYGIIRKKPDIRYKDPAEMERLPQLQLQILCEQAEYVKPGGVLMYSTCTLVRRENEAVVEAFLRHHPHFHLEKLPLPEIFPENKGMLRLVPGQYDTDGFFIARLRRDV